MPRPAYIAREVFDAITKIGGRAAFWHITYEVRQNRRSRGAAIPETIGLAVRSVRRLPPESFACCRAVKSGSQESHRAVTCVI